MDEGDILLSFCACSWSKWALKCLRLQLLSRVIGFQKKLVKETCGVQILAWQERLLKYTGVITDDVQVNK